MARPALFERFPGLPEELPWLSIGTFPTRVERLAGVAPPGVDLWIKRDDASGTRYGGNKVRKLEWLLADARRRKATRLATLGAWGSHHVLATTLYGRAAGFDVDAVVFPQPVSDGAIDHLLVDVALGARLLPAGSYAGVPARVAAARLSPGTYWVPPGGSSPVGTLGWVSAGLELMDQVSQGECPDFDVVYAALGSCGTVAGLWLGLALGGYRGRLVGVRVVDRVVSNQCVVRSLIKRTARLLWRAGATVEPLLGEPELHIEHRYFGEGYAHATPEAEAAVAAAARGGMKLETTYTGKTFAALLADADAGALDGKRALFVNTYNSVDIAPLIPVPRDLEMLPEELRRQLGERRR